MKKFLALFTSAVMLLSLFGCSGGQQASTSANTSTPAPAPADGSTPPQEETWEPTTIEYWTINSETAGGTQVQALVDKFNQTNGKNITVEFRFIPNDYVGVASELQTALVAGNYPGVVQVGYAYLNYFAEYFPQFLDIGDLIGQYAPGDMEVVQSSYTDTTWALGTSMTGKQLGVPYGMSVPVIYYNADMFREAGLDPDNPPTTWEGWYEAAKTIKDVTGNYGFSFKNADTYTTIPSMLCHGATMFELDANKKAVACFNSEDTVAAWTTLQQFTKNDYAPWITINESIAALCGEQLGAMMTTTARMTYLRENCDFDLRTTMFPAYEGHEDDLSVCIGGNILTIVTDTDAKAKASWEFIKFLIQPENIYDWISATGYIPPTANAEQSADIAAYLESNPLIDPALEELNYAKPWTSWPGENSLAIVQSIIDMEDDIMANGADPAARVERCENDVNALLGN